MFFFKYIYIFTILGYVLLYKYYIILYSFKNLELHIIPYIYIYIYICMCIIGHGYARDATNFVTCSARPGPSIAAVSFLVVH